MSLDTVKRVIKPVQVEQMLTDKGYRAICGVDEVGRGPLAGPVVAAAVILPYEIEIYGLDDSKKLTATRREEIFDEIIQRELVCAIGIIDNETIDQINIHKASLMAMRKAVIDLSQKPEFVLVDGNHTIPNIPQPQYAIIGGDASCKAISAASIIAKVTRDKIMERYETIYPDFSFAQHKGYPTPSHLNELRLHGPCDIHRRSFKPVADLVEEYVLV